MIEDHILNPNERFSLQADYMLSKRKHDMMRTHVYTHLHTDRVLFC